MTCVQAKREKVLKNLTVFRGTSVFPGCTTNTFFLVSDDFSFQMSTLLLFRNIFQTSHLDTNKKKKKKKKRIEKPNRHMTEVLTE